MLSPSTILSLGFVASAVATSSPGKPDTLPGCGEVDLFFTGLPPYHPFVLSLGLDPAMVDTALRADAAAVIAAGYNLKVSLAGPELPLDIVRGEMKDHHWDGTGIGFGLRSAQDPTMTILLEDTIQLFRDEAEKAPIMFNYNARTFLWAVKRRFPLSSDCTDKPGTDYGFKVYCDICEQ